MNQLRAISLLGAFCFVAALSACGGDTAGDPLSDERLTLTATGTPAPGWSLTPEQLCATITAEEFSAAAGEDVTARASTLDGCRYTGPTLNARLTETVLSAPEYEQVMPQMGASWVNQVEDSIVLAYTDDGLVFDAWFDVGGEALNLSFPDGAGESVVLAVIEAARSKA